MAEDPGRLDLADPIVASTLAGCRFPPAGSAVTCAVSGGADSLALLVLAAASDLRVTAVHVDHGLRPGSAAEADVVADVARRAGARFRSVSVEVDAGPNLEARARAARYRVLPADVMTGHTADDRAETVLLHLMRGAGPRGAVGMARGSRRPILDLRRRQTHDLCEALGLRPVHDPSNEDPAFRRNRVRAELLPLLADISGRDPVPVLVRQADLFAEVNAHIAAEARDVEVTSARALAAAPVPVAREAIRTWLVEAGVGDGYPVGAEAVARVLAVANGAATATEVDGGWRVSRSAGVLSVRPPTSWQDARRAD